MYIACKKCKYNYDGECDFYDMGSGNEIDMPCYREKELIKEAADNFIQAFVGTESKENENGWVYRLLESPKHSTLSY